MEPQEVYCCKEKKPCKEKVKCLGVIAVILAVLFAGVIGLIIGACISWLVLISLPAVIVLAFILGLLLLITIILLICNRCKH